MMNLELLESFCQNYPEEPDGVLDCISVAVTAAYNKLGTLLAVGCNDGRVVVWDFMTRGIAKVITAHSHPRLLPLLVTKRAQDPHRLY
ncbi:Retinoblastoma-binding protein 5 [Orchesella cincta]|uniref:Retinoblastoma-binding protein 5 n=1 Tax=Orchesella cincta TaxID=48709 RepID=A0A1D2NJW7_ORCCI|nr:Retinoblastoma-binding protein 5 [Orchesella cincta]